MKQFAVVAFAYLNLISNLYAKPVHLKVDGGEGYFVISNSNEEKFYSSENIFYRNADGDYVTRNRQYHLQAYPVSENGVISGNLSNVNIISIVSLSQETYKVEISGNLNASTTLRTGSDLEFNGRSHDVASATSDFNISTTVYDSLGHARVVTVYFAHTGGTHTTSNRLDFWDFHVLGNLSDLNPKYVEGRGAFVIQEGSLVFGENGSLLQLSEAISKTPADTNGILSAGERLNPSAVGALGNIPWADGANPVQLGYGNSRFRVDFGQEPDSRAVITQFAGQSAVSHVEQDGRPSGTLTGVDFASDGKIMGYFSNGITRTLYQLPLASFLGADFLDEVTPGIYSTNEGTGEAMIGFPTSSNFGYVVWIRN